MSIDFISNMSRSADDGDLSWAREADVIVVGSGAAGLFAATEAAEMGTSTLVVESQPAIGGSSRLSGGYVVLCETELESGRRGELLDDLDDAHHHDSYFELSRVYVDNASDTYFRLKDLGVEFVATMKFSHMSRAWAHEPGGIGGGAEIVSRLESAAKRRGVETLVSTRAQGLLHGDNGRVIGITVSTAGGTENYKARKAVVLASGGFTRNRDLIKRYGRPGADKIFALTGAGSLGEGLLMAMKASAATSYLETGIAPTGPADPSANALSLINYKGAILVNKQGRRFCRESDVYVDLSWAGLEQTETLMIQVYDSRIREEYRRWRLSSILGVCREHSAPSIGELGLQLSAAYGVDAANLGATVDAYNGYVEAGADPEFGRSNLVGSDGALRKIDAPPYFAMVLVPGTTHFNGGLRTNRNMQVVDRNGDIILGLYAAGEVAGGFHGIGYMSGSSIGSALIFGRIAGKNAADERCGLEENSAATNSRISI